MYGNINENQCLVLVAIEQTNDIPILVFSGKQLSTEHAATPTKIIAMILHL